MMMWIDVPDEATSYEGPKLRSFEEIMLIDGLEDSEHEMEGDLS